jgi:hypothetical protein
MTSEKNLQQNGGRKRRMTKRKSHKRRHTHKGNRGASWPQFVKKTYLDMKRSDKGATFKDAMKEASRRKKAGQFP